MNEQNRSREDYIQEIKQIQASDSLRQHILVQAAAASDRRSPSHQRRTLVWALSGAAALVILVLALPWLFALFTTAMGGGTGKSPSDGRHFDLYKGPILPLTAVEGGEGLLVNRHLVLDLSLFTPKVPTSTAQYKVLQLTDRYVLENPTDKAITLKAVVPFVGSLNQTPDLMPALTLDGKPLESRFFAGSIIYSLDKDGLNWEHATSSDAYAKALADGTYLKQGMAGLSAKGTTPVTIYTFKDLNKQPEFGDAASFGLNAVVDPEKSKVLAFGLSGMTFDEATGHVIISGWLMHGEDQGVVAVLGEPLKDVTLKGYTDGGCTEELVGINGGIETGAAILQDVFRQQLDAYVRRSVNLTERFKQNSDARQQKHFSDAVYDSALALLQQQLQKSYPRFWDPVIHMDSLLGDALTTARVLYLAVDVTVPAHQYAELTIASIRPPHQNIYRSGLRQKDKNLFGIDWLTSTGGSLALRHLTADVILPEGTKVRYQNLGLSEDATGKVKITLDKDIAHYYLAITVLDSLK